MATPPSPESPVPNTPEDDYHGTAILITETHDSHYALRFDDIFAIGLYKMALDAGSEDPVFTSDPDVTHVASFLQVVLSGVVGP